MSTADTHHMQLPAFDAGSPGDLALVVPDGPRLTYQSLQEQIQRMADTLAAFGVKRGDRVAIAVPNSAETIIAFLGAAVAGTAAPLNPNYTEEEFRFYMADTNANTLIVPPGGGEAARRAMPDGAIVIEAALDSNGVLQLESSAPRRSGATASQPSADDIALVLHTSGTTSRPKRVPLRHRNLIASSNNIVKTYALGQDDVSLCVMPLFHVHGLVASTLATLSTGGAVIVPSRFNPLGFWSLVRDHRVTWYSAVPTLHQLVLTRSGGTRPSGVESLRFARSCSASLPPSTMEQLETLLGVPTLEAYGMTEASHQMASNPLPPASRKPGAVGPGTGVQIGIMDEAGELLSVGSVGEVVIQGPNVIDGYEQNPEANATSFTNGWFRTGDQGTLDADSYLTLLGRIKELINRGGEKIAPREIDEVLLKHAAVAEAVCFGVPHRVWGEEVAVAVVLREQVSEEELRRHCRQHLSEYKVPKTIYIVEALPRTATGKIQRRYVAAALGAGK